MMMQTAMILTALMMIDSAEEKASDTVESLQLNPLLYDHWTLYEPHFYTFRFTVPSCTRMV